MPSNGRLLEEEEKEKTIILGYIHHQTFQKYKYNGVLDVYVTTTYFLVEDRFYQQKKGMAMGSSLSLVVSNIFVEYFDNFNLDSTQYKPSIWLRHVDDTLVYGHMTMRNCNHFVNTSVVSDLPYSLLWKQKLVVLFLNVLVSGKGTTPQTKVYRKPHTGCYLHSESNHPYHIGRCCSRLDQQSKYCLQGEN
jgi:hypothetical protein